MSINDKVPIEIEIGTLSILIAGLYTGHTGVNIHAIPSSLYIEVAEKVSEYLSSWDYNKISFEDWIRYNLIIAPKELFNEVELNEYQGDDIYIERRIGNATLIATARIEK